MDTIFSVGGKVIVLYYPQFRSQVSGMKLRQHLKESKLWGKLSIICAFPEHSMDHTSPNLSILKDPHQIN